MTQCVKFVMPLSHKYPHLPTHTQTHTHAGTHKQKPNSHRPKRKKEKEKIKNLHKPANMIWLNMLFYLCAACSHLFFLYTSLQQKEYVTVGQDDAKLCLKIHQSLRIIKDNSRLISMAATVNPCLE